MGLMVDQLVGKPYIHGSYRCEEYFKLPILVFKWFALIYFVGDFLRFYLFVPWDSSPFGRIICLLVFHASNKQIQVFEDPNRQPLL